MASIEVVSGGERFECAAQQVAKTCVEHGFMVDTEQPDYLAVVGGDGSYIKAMRERDYPEVPTFGINEGSLGFFQEVTLAGLSDFLKALRAQQVRIDQRHLLAVVDDQGQEIARAVNEVHVVRDTTQAMKAQIQINDGKFAKFVGDGVIVATAQGSTAYAAAAGGPIVDQQAPVFTVVPSNAHNTILYESIPAPLVVHDTSHVVITPEHSNERPVRVEVDGQRLNWESRAIRIQKSARYLQVLRLANHDSIEHLAKKMIR